MKTPLNLCPGSHSNRKNALKSLRYAPPRDGTDVISTEATDCFTVRRGVERPLYFFLLSRYFFRRVQPQRRDTKTVAAFSRFGPY